MAHQAQGARGRFFFSLSHRIPCLQFIGCEDLILCTHWLLQKPVTSTVREKMAEYYASKCSVGKRLCESITQYENTSMLEINMLPHSWFFIGKKSFCRGKDGCGANHGRWVISPIAQGNKECCKRGKFHYSLTFHEQSKILLLIRVKKKANASSEWKRWVCDWGPYGELLVYSLHMAPSYYS